MKNHNQYQNKSNQPRLSNRTTTSVWIYRIYGVYKTNLNAESWCPSQPLACEFERCCINASPSNMCNTTLHGQTATHLMKVRRCNRATSALCLAPLDCHVSTFQPKFVLGRNATTRCSRTFIDWKVAPRLSETVWRSNSTSLFLGTTISELQVATCLNKSATMYGGSVLCMAILDH